MNGQIIRIDRFGKVRKPFNDYIGGKFFHRND
jgi:hypothetical protein